MTKRADDRKCLTSVVAQVLFRTSTMSAECQHFPYV